MNKIVHVSVVKHASGDALGDMYAERERQRKALGHRPTAFETMLAEQMANDIDLLERMDN